MIIPNRKDGAHDAFFDKTDKYGKKRDLSKNIRSIILGPCIYELDKANEYIEYAKFTGNKLNVPVYKVIDNNDVYVLRDV